MALAKDTSGDNKRRSIPKDIKNNPNGTTTTSISNGWLSYKEKIKNNVRKCWLLLTDPSHCTWWPVPGILILVEIIINFIIIEKVNYTEIDWKAYMQVN